MIFYRGILKKGETKPEKMRPAANDPETMNQTREKETKPAGDRQK